MSSLGTTQANVFVLTRDRTLSKPFYGQVLGLTLTADGDYSSVFDLNGQQLHLTTAKDHVASPHPVLGWAVSDIVATAQDLVTKGVRFTIYDGYGQDALGIYAAPDGGSKMAWFADPDGNMLSLSQG